MTLVLILLTVTVAAAAIAVAMGRIGGGMPAAESTLPPVGLPDGRVQASDLDRLRLAPALRGYRMDQVDAVISRLATELNHRDAEIAVLRQLAGVAPGTQLGTVDYLEEQDRTPATGYWGQEFLPGHVSSGAVEGGREDPADAPGPAADDAATRRWDGGE